MRNFYLILFTAISFTGFSQTYEDLQTFETSNDNISAFGGNSSVVVVADPETGGTRGNVAKVTSTAGGDIWKGIEFDMTRNVDLTTYKTMKIDVYSDSAITIGPQVQNGVDGAPTSLTTLTHDGSGWNTFTITFDQSLDGKAPANGAYAKFVIYSNWDAANSTFMNPAPDRVFYFDNIQGVGIDAPTAAVPTDAPTTNYTYPAANVLSIFSDYTDVAYTRESWCVATETVETIAGNEVLKFVNTEYYAAAGTFDLSSVERLEIDYWFAESTVGGAAIKLFIKIEDLVNSVDHVIDLAPAGITGGSWQSVSVDLSTITFPVTMDLSNIGRFFIDNTNEGGSFYIDNFIFSADQSLSRTAKSINSFSVYPNPATDIVRVSADESIDTVEVFDLLGKRVLAKTPKNKNFNLNVSNLRKGVYIVKAKAGDKQSTTKLVK